MDCLNSEYILVELHVTSENYSMVPATTLDSVAKQKSNLIWYQYTDCPGGIYIVEYASDWSC